MSSSVEQIKERLSIVDVVSSYLKLEKSGQNYKAVCPFHSEKSPSFFVSPSRSSYYCFGCGAKGDIFTFVEQFEGLDFKGALAVLAGRAGVTLEPYRGTDPKEKSEKDRLFELMQAAATFYQEQFSANTEAQEYVLGRGVTKETIHAFRIGFAPAEWRGLATAMRAKGFTDAELLSAGLVKRPDENPSGDVYDRFRDRVMFPIADTGGRVIAFSGRILHDDGSGVQGKYINSPETPIFKKGSTLYGLDKAKFEIRRRDSAVLVEGQMDLVLSHQAGFTNTVASSGTALGDSLLADEGKGLLSGLGAVHALSKNLIIAFDADKAGLRAAGRAEKIGLGLGMNVKVAKLPKGMDPADVIRTQGPEAWTKILAHAEHIVLCYLEVLMEHPLSDHARMRAIRDRILPYVAVMPSAVERAHFVREIHKKTAIPEEALLEDVARLSAEEKKKIVPASKKTETAPTAPSRSTRIQDRLFGILFWQESMPEPEIDLSVLTKRLSEILGAEAYHARIDIPPDKKSEHIFEVEMLYQNQKHLHKEMEELLDNLEEETLSARLETLMTKLAQAEQSSDSDALQHLLQESQSITTRLNSIKTRRHLHQ